MDDDSILCARCGCACGWHKCDHCGGTGCCDDEFSDVDETLDCDVCWGRGGWWECVSSEDWCQSNPLPGREDCLRGPRSE